MGMLRVWQYFDAKGIEYWIIELKKQVRIEGCCDSLLFYNGAEEAWHICNRNFVIDEHCHRATYDQLRRQWQKYWNNTDTPFALVDIIEQELAVWTFYSPIDHLSARKERSNPLDQLARYISRVHSSKMPQPDTDETSTRFRECLAWFFHLKRPVEIIEIVDCGSSETKKICKKSEWIGYLPHKTTNQWIVVDVTKQDINDVTCRPVPFDNVEIEWQRMFCDTKMPNRPNFTLEDIVER